MERRLRRICRQDRLAGGCPKDSEDLRPVSRDTFMSRSPSSVSGLSSTASLMSSGSSFWPLIMSTATLTTAAVATSPIPLSSMRSLPGPTAVIHLFPEARAPSIRLLSITSLTVSGSTLPLDSIPARIRTCSETPCLMALPADGYMLTTTCRSRCLSSHLSADHRNRPLPCCTTCAATQDRKPPKGTRGQAHEDAGKRGRRWLQGM
mmetsp:Transcript_31478/g.74807  ORF Transcript_31478/g.74807 Transcript_31478/m.74807 type:complete len:206 (-) Transcript_31478:2125-2742(-)